MRERTPTELEGCVLGTLHLLEPCTAYRVRREFLDSPSPYWSGSAGAIYPLIERLRKGGLVTAGPRPVGPRRSRFYRLTPAGLDALRAWMRPPLPEVVIGVPSDPLRTRLGFLQALSARERRAFLEDATRRVAVHRRAVEAEVARKRRERDLYGLLIARGAAAAMRARQAWLREVIRVLARPGRRP